MIGKCDICGRETNRLHTLRGYKLCSKHMHQLFDHGKFLDNNPRTQNDLNDFRIEGNIVIFDLYDQRQNKDAEFIIDLDDLEKVKYHKWRESYGHIVTGNNTASKPTIYLANLIMNLNDNNFIVDHKNGNGFDNRKLNLRICTQSKNTLNKSFMKRNTTGFIGVSPENRIERKAKYCSEIRYEGKRFHIGAYESLEEAVYARWIAELILFGEYRNTNNDEERFKLINNIPQGRKIQISNYVSGKINNKLSV